MKIFYVHHALRDISNPPSQNDGLKKLGVKDAKLVAKLFREASEKIKFKAMHTSSFPRCVETAKIINKYLKLPIIIDDRLNEFENVHAAVQNKELNHEKETWVDCQKRIVRVIKDIVFSSEDDEAVICVTSGVNISAFIDVAYKLKPDEKRPFPLVPSCSPIGFDVSKETFDEYEI